MKRILARELFNVPPSDTPLPFDVRLLAPLLLLLLLTCTQEPPPRRHLSGTTMGTSYTVTYYGGPSSDHVRSKLQDLFTGIDRQLSNWNPDSWVRRFNAQDANTLMELPEHAETVLRHTLRLSRKTNGALDPTLGRPINMWGFGPFEHKRPIDRTELEKVLNGTGIEKLTIHNDPPALSKSHPALRLNFSATAKGYVIDRVASLLNEQHIERYKINIGGDLRTRGSPAGDDTWKIVIRTPSSDQTEENGSRRILQLNDRAVATSGDYHRFITVDGEKQPHILDPDTGAPVETTLTSVSVLAPTALKADGLATACFVLGESNARELLKSMQDVEALFIHRTPSGHFRKRHTERWPEPPRRRN